jgi:enoyl-CoA hydratase/carnithine racemase
MQDKEVIYTKEHGIATIRLNRPRAMNAFTPEMMKDILVSIDDVKKDDNVRALIITGTGRAFCSGADVKAMAARASQAPSDIQDEPGGVNMSLVLRMLDKPVIASVNGLAVGGGFDLACACDIRIASDQARFAELFIRRGLIPAMGGIYFLPRLVGIGKAFELIWTGDMIDAREAERIGLVNKVVPHDELEDATFEFAGKLANGPPLAIQRAKHILYEGLQTDLETSLDQVRSAMVLLMQSEDHKEGVRAFVEKREPLFKGR